MKVLKIVAVAVLVVGVLVAVIAPIGPLPGFFIGGTATAAPTVWADTSNTHEIRLKVPGTLPRVVIIWVIQHNGELHVIGSPDSGWVKRIGNGGSVEMRLGDETYALNAQPVTQGWENVLTAYVDKYKTDYPDIVAGFPSPEEAAGNFALFRLNRT